MEATIEVSGLRKRFGPVLALDGMSFTVAPGQVTGFVGPNGAGKSTTMRVVLGLDAADEGTALISGQPYASLRHPLSHVGALLDAAALQPSRSARNHLLWLAHSQGLDARRVDEVVAQAGLGSAIRRKAGGFSLGMRQRLGIAAALLGDPPVLMMDEPFNGMDPEGIVWMRGFLRSLAAQGRAVLVSSHLMSEVQDSADHLVVVGRGHVIADTSVAALIAAASGDRVSVRTSARAQAMTVLAHAGATVAATGPDTLTVSGLAPGKIVALLSDGSVPFTEISAHRATLDTVVRLPAPQVTACTFGGAGLDRLFVTTSTIGTEGWARVKRESTRRSRSFSIPSTRESVAFRSSPSATSSGNGSVSSVRKWPNSDSSSSPTGFSSETGICELRRICSTSSEVRSRSRPISNAVGSRPSSPRSFRSERTIPI